MHRPLFVLLATAFIAASSLAGAAETRVSPGPGNEGLKWFREAKFGLFIHWGLYALPAGYWKGARSPGNGEWVMERMKIPAAEYERLAGQFNPVKFDADAWAQLAVDAGMKYVVLTAKHHDGFALYRSAASQFNVADATPFGRDVVGELAAACARRGLRFGVYYSQSLDWHERGGLGNDWDFPSDAEKDRDGSYDLYLREKVEPQVRELLTRYGPLALVWFDMATLMERSNRAGRLISLVRSLQPAALINGRTGTSGDYLTTGDNAIPPTASDRPWEVPMTMNHSWGFRSDDHAWKSPNELVFTLVDIVAKGGNLLLNVGPMADGVIPTPSQEALRTIGQWLRHNGEAVYRTGPSPFGEEFGDHARNLKDRTGQPVFLRYRDWRCTTRPGKLYFTIFKTDRDGDNAYFVLPTFKNKIMSVHELDQGKRVPYEVKTLPDGRRYIMPPRWVDDSLGTVYVVEIEGDSLLR
jgi:alpha-L-fucosidase